MTDAITIRKAEEKDIPLILKFIKGIAEYEKLLHEVEANEEKLRESLFSQNANTEVLLCYFGDVPVAYAVYFHNFSTFVGKKGIYLEDIFVYPEYRGKGIGKKLLKYIAQIAVERNCGRMEWAVLNWNKPAIEFYKSIGAKPMDEWSIFRLTEPALKKFVEQAQAKSQKPSPLIPLPKGEGNKS
jgi:GNAT superfamily N-acetyltransferase